ncbi:MAG: MBL fold metallo-hydrolase, partial [Synergistaceae bacterium]|nr:MBL fold metallo-hydrolase [Synergistaceae bacterium]
MPSAKVSFLGGVGEVTGSCYLLENMGCRILVDCGMYQGNGADERNTAALDFSPADIDAVVLTHAHIDHSGRIPLLVARGFKGTIWATDPTIELVSVLLRDTAKLMAEESEWRSRKNARKGLPPVKPVYSERDVEETLKRFRYARYDERTEVAPGCGIRFRDAGHIMGAAMVEIWLENDGSNIKIVFSGDMGSSDVTIERPHTIIEEADYVVIESTYGGRNHKNLADTRSEFREGIAKAIEIRGKILIPTFTVDRAQRILYEIKRLQLDPSFPSTPPIFFDSPMGERATRIYEKYSSLLSRELQDMIREGHNPFAPEGLSYTTSVEASRAINETTEAIVLAGSGMCSGGRIIHHLKHNLWDGKCNVFFVGYQAYGTLGRRLVDGERNLRIANEDITVNATLHTLGGFSAHAGRDDLLKWASNFRRGASFFVTHGEPASSDALAGGIREMGYEAAVPMVRAVYDLSVPEAAITRPIFQAKPDAECDRLIVMALLAEIAS